MTKKSFAVIGLGRFGSYVVKELIKYSDDVLAMDISAENVEAISPYINNCVICDATKKNNLEELGVQSIDHAIVAIGNNLTASLFTTINLKALGVKEITVRVDDESHKEVFKTLGATSVIFPEEASAISLANRILSTNILDYYKVKGGYALVQILVPYGYRSKCLADLSLRQRLDISIVGIIRDGKFFIPKGTDEIRPKDILLVIGQNKQIRRFEDYINE